MTRVTHILCPTDFSDASRHALEHSDALARWYNVPLTVVYVFENRPAMDVPAMVLDDEERARLMADLQRFTAHASPTVRVTLRVDQPRAPFRG
jgi:nucleotide-binding universal stress UspA family protein